MSATASACKLQAVRLSTSAGVAGRRARCGQPVRAEAGARGGRGRGGRDRQRPGRVRLWLGTSVWEILCHGVKACVGRVRAASSVHVTWLGVFWVGIGIGIISSAWASPELC